MISSGTSSATVVSTGASVGLSQITVADTGASAVLSTGVSVSAGISSEVSLDVKVNTTLSTLQSAIVVQGSNLNLPDIIIDFNGTTISSLAQFKTVVADMVVRAAQAAGFTS